MIILGNTTKLSFFPRFTHIIPAILIFQLMIDIPIALHTGCGFGVYSFDTKILILALSRPGFPLKPGLR